MDYLANATYSVEDNKLRLYPFSRLDSDDYQKVKDKGFKWAPKQELFVAPSWTPEREDFCLEMAGEIEPEQSTLAERAQAKAVKWSNAAGRTHRPAPWKNGGSNEKARRRP